VYCKRRVATATKLLTFKICPLPGGQLSSTHYSQLSWREVLVNNVIHYVPVVSFRWNFSYRERLQQQNGAIGKKDGVKTTCIWLRLVQGHVYSSLSPLPPPLSLPLQMCSRPERHFRPPHTPPPHHRIMDRFWQPRPMSRMASILETVSMIAEFGQQQ
jgi:hypothetical protein